MLHEKILKGIISDLMKVPMSKHEGELGDHEHSGMDLGDHHEAKIEIVSPGKPPEMEDELDEDKDLLSHKAASHKSQMKKLHSMKK